MSFVFLCVHSNEHSIHTPRTLHTRLVSPTTHTHQPPPSTLPWVYSSTMRSRDNPLSICAALIDKSRRYIPPLLPILLSPVSPCSALPSPNLVAAVGVVVVWAPSVVGLDAGGGVVVCGSDGRVVESMRAESLRLRIVLSGAAGAVSGVLLLPSLTDTGYGWVWGVWGVGGVLMWVGWMGCVMRRMMGHGVCAFVCYGGGEVHLSWNIMAYTTPTRHHHAPRPPIPPKYHIPVAVVCTPPCPMSSATASPLYAPTRALPSLPTSSSSSS